MEKRIIYEQDDYLTGENGIVWATYQHYQAEILKDTLLAQNIACEVYEQPLENGRLYLLRVPEPRKVEEAMDFIWRDDTGLKLQPDWSYPAGAENESFQRWVKDI
jgi:hypothetical protein